MSIITKRFTRELQFLRRMSTVHVSEADIINEPMLYGASMNFCRVNGGPLANSVLNHIEYSVGDMMGHHGLLGYHPVIDTKSVMLMPGQYPAIPGWHCDGVVRPDAHSQPDLNGLNAPISHYTTVIGGEGTEFIEQDITLAVDTDSVWTSVNQQVPDDVATTRTDPGEVVRFSRSTLHRAPVTMHRHWRFFFRLSFYHMPCMNQLRKQVQVYTQGGGW